MKQSRKGFHRHALAAAVVLALAGAAAQAQLSTSTLKGQITSGATAAQAGIPVVAVNKDNGNTYRTTTRADGSYVLPGLAPGNYSIRIEGKNSEVITLQVGETASLDLALAGEGTQQVTIVGSTNRKNVKTSEVGTSVSPVQIEALPQNNRNFLSFADAAPGVRFQTAGDTGQSKMQSGAQSADNVNVFIDGVGQKNYALTGGLVGQDSSRGNPFPQIAIAEYKVISQNYKAEFDQVSSAAVTAVTKSGTNENHGDVFWDHTDNKLTAYSPFEKSKERSGVPRPTYSQEQFGISTGGAFVQDKIHYFVAYEGKHIENPRQVVLGNAEGLGTGSYAQALRSQQGSAVNVFNEDLLFGKLDFQINDEQHLDISLKFRSETDKAPADATYSAPGNIYNRKVSETRLDVRHEWATDKWLNTARLGYEDSSWKPSPTDDGPYVEWKRTNYADVLRTGSAPTSQSKGQRGLLLQDDLAYTGMSGHNIKGGVKVKFIEADLHGNRWIHDHVGRLLADDGASYTEVLFDKATSPSDLNYKDTQFGMFLQDDWQLNKQLELNLGVRWDYESNMLNNGYVTPTALVSALNGPDPRAPAQTYAQTLANAGVNINDYISSGHNRKAFTGAVQPRLGFSYDVFDDKRSVVFGGWGRAYDRSIADHAYVEAANNNANQEIYLIKNNIKAPYTDQFSLGLRQQVGEWNTEVGYTNSYSHNGFIWSGAYYVADGSAGSSAIDPAGRAPLNGYGNMLLGDFSISTKTQTIFLKADKPYSPSTHWGASLAYTYSDGQTTDPSWSSTDGYNWVPTKPAGSSLHRTSEVEKHRLVASGITDLLGEGFMLSGKTIFGSGLPYRVTDCGSGWSTCYYREGTGSFFKQLDIGVSKQFKVNFGGKVTVRADILNALNSRNYGGFDSWVGGPGTPPANASGGDNANFGRPSSMASAMRTVKLGLAYKW